jgi:flagellar basal-body rod protein FlgF
MAVQARDGSEAFVRGGSLKVYSVGLLETERGELVLGDNGPLAVPPFTQIALAADGTISIVPQGQGPETMAQIGRLRLVNPEVERLTKRPDGLIAAADGAEVESDANVKIASGFIETSNVNIASTLVDMIEFQRQFEVAVRMMQAADENASRAASLASIS